MSKIYVVYLEDYDLGKIIKSVHKTEDGAVKEIIELNNTEKTYSGDYFDYEAFDLYN